MKKLKLKSIDLVDENFKKLSALFPNCISETSDGKTINFELLKQELNYTDLGGDKERYRLEWPGKREAIVTANLPTTNTLRPVKEDSVDFNKTQNLYLEGDNLEVLKLLQESYLSKIKMIYIDPPYNTGKDFVYKDNFRKDANKELIDSGQKNEYNQRLFVNPETAGRYHSNWLSMMYPRLKLARNLLTENGVIFISIDDNEIDNLKKLCDEIFGGNNFIANVVRRRRLSQANLAQNISSIHEYVLIYSRSSKTLLNKIKQEIDESKYKNPDNDERGPYVTMPCTNKGGSKYKIVTPSGKEIYDEWRFKKETFEKLKFENKLVFPREGEGKPRYKLFLSEKKKSGVIPNSWWDSISSNQEATIEVKKLFGGKSYFDFPKPVDLIKRIIELSVNDHDLVLDFFSGSATTAHSVMDFNSINEAKIKYIMVQLAENIDVESDAYKDGYKNICEIAKERIRRAAKKIKNETKAEIDYGFRVYRLDSSNMKDVYYNPKDYSQDNLNLFIENIKPDRTSDDLLAQIILDLGLPLSIKIEEKTLLGKKFFKVGDNSLFVCFDKKISEDFVKEIVKKKPLRIVFKDGSFVDDNAKINVKQLMKQLSPSTEIKII